MVGLRAQGSEARILRLHGRRELPPGGEGLLRRFERLQACPAAFNQHRSVASRALIAFAVPPLLPPNRPRAVPASTSTRLHLRSTAISSSLPARRPAG